MDGYFRSGLAPSTSQTYNLVKHRFLSFCDKANLCPLPLTENLLCRFVGYLSDDGLAPSSIKSYLSAVRHLQLAMHMNNSNVGNMARLEQVLKGVKRQFVKKNLTKKQRLPMTPDLLLKMKKVWSNEPSKFDNIMLWAASCVCYFGFLCSGKITILSEAAYDKAVHLNMEDITVDNVANSSIVKVVIKASKTDHLEKELTYILAGLTMSCVL